jgi:hypothetical protein
MGFVCELHRIISAKSRVRLLDRGQGVNGRRWRFLLRLVAASEGLDLTLTWSTPTSFLWKFDDEAIWEAVREPPWDDEEPENREPRRLRG